jgi:DNA mismatch endonuclease (patch repair protein)
MLVAERLRGWRLHPKQIPFGPDLYFPTERLAVFIDGCFWHGCPICGHVPKTNTEYWSAKIARNRRRDAAARRALNRAGYAVLRLRECDIKARRTKCFARIRRLLLNSVA